MIKFNSESGRIKHLGSSSVSENLIQAIKTSKDYVYNVENVCKICENKAYIFKWVRAEDNDIDMILNEIKRGYKLALNKCLGKKPAELSERKIVNIFAAIRSFEKTLPKPHWSIDESKPLGASLIRNTKSGKTYYVYGWDGLYGASKKQVEKKLSLKSVRGKKIDYKVLVARRFSKTAKELMKNGGDSVLIDLGFMGDEERAEVTLQGSLTSEDPLILLLLQFLESFREPEGIKRELEMLREKYIIGEIPFEEYEKRKKGIKSIMGFPMPRVDRYVVDAVVRAFKEYYRVTDCGHLHISERREPYFPPSHTRVESSFEEQLKRVSLGIGIYPSEEEAKEKLDELREVYTELLEKINQLYRSELVATVVKKDVDGNLYKNEVRFLCKSCEESLINRFEVHHPCEGSNCLFKRFTHKLGEQMGYNVRYVSVYDFGVLQSRGGNMVISREKLNQPLNNVLMFKPNLIISVHNFFSNKLATTRHTLGISTPWRRERTRTKEMKAEAFDSAMTFLVPTLAYNCETDEHVYVPIETIKPSTAKIVEKLASIEFTVKPTEKAYRAAHDHIIEICRSLGLEFGFKPDTEYRVGSDRIDVAWSNRDTGDLEVAIEVELAKSVTGDLWKLCEAHPKLAVLIVKGGYYKIALDHAVKSEIIRRMNQKIMIFDISEKAHKVIEGGKLLTLPEGVES